ncbi:MAG TPA: CPBP family glutamic-type intramembrane protease [Candidatus Desulfaltia sp.]|nr:CPBP family glutamic-type intramembrane protease [Candidatus Desulfaltia sp.]
MEAKNELLRFYLLTLLLSWPLWFLSGVLGREESFYDTKWLTAQVGVFAPALSALILSGRLSARHRRNSVRLALVIGAVLLLAFFIARERRSSIGEFSPAILAVVTATALAVVVYLSPFNRYFLHVSTAEKHGATKGRWMALALISFPALFLFSWLIVGLSGGSFDVASFHNGWAGFLKILMTVFAMNLILGGSLGEEPGWSGYALPLWLRFCTPLEAGRNLGFFCALWHLPLDIFGGGGFWVLTVLARIVWGIAVYIVFTWFYLKANRAVLVPVILHTSVNILPDLGFVAFQPSFLLMAVITGGAALTLGFRKEMRAEPR